MKRRMILMVGLLLTTAVAWAHGTDTGPHGGMRVDAGNFHVEAFAKETAVLVYLYDADNKPVDAAGARGTGIFVVNGKSQRIELTPTGTNSLTGTSSVPLPAPLKGAVQINLPAGQSLQAKF
jgi:hypothetical protein